jgi:hypothetical protein
MVINKSDPDETKEHAIMTFDEPTFKFGTITQGERRPHTFTFENKGDAPLIIASVKPSCGCTVTKDWPKEPILPGEKGEIAIEFNSEKKKGHVSKGVTILTNGIPKTIILNIEGTVIAPDPTNTPELNNKQ